MNGGPFGVDDFAEGSRPSFVTGTTVNLELLDSPPQPIPGTLILQSGRWLRVRTEQALRTGVPVKVEGAGWCVLGEIAYCEPSDEKWIVSIEGSQLLCGLERMSWFQHGK
jgi:hypothetical protein